LGGQIAALLFIVPRLQDRRKGGLFFYGKMWYAENGILQREEDPNEIL